ncbi:hypothetical protein N9972_00920 [bacterium]|jgi:hypothetical protein|nr:hypothetical protein [bacterium]
MIRIENLTAEQYAMLDQLWNFANQDEYLEWYETLEDPDRQQAITLMRLLAYEVLEHKVDRYREQARELLAQFRL